MAISYRVRQLRISNGSMRLINCRTYELKEYVGSNIPPYAILSHTWDEEEVSFAEFVTNQAGARLKAGFRKIRLTCQQALADGLAYAWVDTCCIDKSSSSELSEAINSMFQWYAQSSICYAYLPDVTQTNFSAEFPQCRWFSRGWTLQEMLAPSDVVFFDAMWHRVGSKQELAFWISSFTQIDIKVLQGLGEGMERSIDGELSFGAFCVAKRMSWASNRITTRLEDTAYCLLGLFGVNMPLLYGEGKKAFIRLQEEIMRHYDDDSILAWSLESTSIQSIDVLHDEAISVWVPPASTILASSPQDFKNCYNLDYAARSISPFMMTNLGLQIELPLLPIRPPEPCQVDHTHSYVALLSCYRGSGSSMLGILLFPSDNARDPTQRVVRVSVQGGKHTVLINPRDAAKAVPTKVTIVQQDQQERQIARVHGYRQIVVNEAQAIECTGYYASSAYALDPNKSSFYFHDTCDRGMWSQETKVLTVGRTWGPPNMFVVKFQSSKYPVNGEFSVLITDHNLAVRRGSMSFKDYQDVYGFLQSHPQREDSTDIILDPTGEKFRMLVSMTDRVVFKWRIIEIHVDGISSTI